MSILIETIGTKTLVIGYDHRFGKNREGGFDYLKMNKDNYGFEIEEISRQSIRERQRCAFRTHPSARTSIGTHHRNCH